MVEVCECQSDQSRAVNDILHCGSLPPINAVTGELRNAWRDLKRLVVKTYSRHYAQDTVGEQLIDCSSVDDVDHRLVQSNPNDSICFAVV
mgnify:CR=1 FL=1